MKNRKFALFIVLSLLLMLLLPGTALAHSGRTDGSGGHYDHSTGEYHYHHGYPAHDHYDMDGDGDIDCPYTYKASDNDNKPEPTSTPSILIKPQKSALEYYYERYPEEYEKHLEIEKKIKEETQAIIKASNERRAKGITSGGQSSVLDELAEKNNEQQEKAAEEETEYDYAFWEGYTEGYMDGCNETTATMERETAEKMDAEYQRGFEEGNKKTNIYATASSILFGIILLLSIELIGRIRNKR